MEFVVKHFNELSTTELYEILNTRMPFMSFAGMMVEEWQAA